MKGKLDRGLDRRCGVASAVFWALGRGEEGTEPEGEAFNLPVDLCRCEQNGIQAAEMVSLLSGWLGSRWKESAEVVRTSDQKAAWASPFGGFYEHSQLGGEVGADPECTGGITYLIWSGNDLGIPPGADGTSRLARIACCCQFIFSPADSLEIQLKFALNFIRRILKDCSFVPHLLERRNVKNRTQDFCGGTVSWRTWTTANTPLKKNKNTDLSECERTS